MGDEHDAVLDKARESEPELAVDDELGESLSILELPLIENTTNKVNNNQTNKAIKK